MQERVGDYLAVQAFEDVLSAEGHLFATQVGFLGDAWDGRLLRVARGLRVRAGWWGGAYKKASGNCHDGRDGSGDDFFHFSWVSRSGPSDTPVGNNQEYHASGFRR